MDFNLTKPCSGKCKCPFRTDSLKGWLGKGRATQIIQGLYEDDKTFSCHKTNNIGEDGEVVETMNTQHCAGAMILLEKSDRPNQLMRISERIGYYDRTKLDMDAPVFNTPEEFIEHHTNEYD